MKHFIILLSIFWASSLIAQSNISHSDKTKKAPVVKSNQITGYSSTIIHAQDKTWGYDICQGKRLLIHQPGIPGLPGNKGFKFKADAKKVAWLAIEKIKKGEMPPTITIEELKKLKVLKD